MEAMPSRVESGGAFLAEFRIWVANSFPSASGEWSDDDFNALAPESAARRLYGIAISSINLRHHWKTLSRISAAGVNELSSVIHSSDACAV